MRKFGLVILCVWLAGCSSSEKKEAATEAPKTTRKTPEKFKVRFDTSKGQFDMECERAWAPRGVDRFFELVENKFYDDARFFRVVKNFVVQFGLNKDPQQNQLWAQMQILDDTPAQPNKRGYVTFAKRGPNTRTTQLFINLRDNPPLDAQGFAPICRIPDAGMEVVDQLYWQYGDGPPMGQGPEQSKVMAMGNEYLTRNFPNLDFIKTAKVVE